jgi:hypothetical protein
MIYFLFENHFFSGPGRLGDTTFFGIIYRLTVYRQLLSGTILRRHADAFNGISMSPTLIPTSFPTTSAPTTSAPTYASLSALRLQIYDDAVMADQFVGLLPAAIFTNPTTFPAVVSFDFGPGTGGACFEFIVC